MSNSLYTCNCDVIHEDIVNDVKANENFPQVQIQLYRWDGTCCLAVVDGEPVSLVPRTQAVDLMEAVRAIVLN